MMTLEDADGKELRLPDTGMEEKVAKKTVSTHLKRRRK